MDIASIDESETDRERHDTVQLFLENEDFASELEPLIKQIGDLERLMAKTSVGKVNPREVLQLRKALSSIESLKHCCSNNPNLAATWPPWSTGLPKD